MKKLITIILVALVPFVTMAQKRSKKDQVGELRFMTIHGVSIPQMSGDEIEMVITDLGDSGSEEAQKLYKKVSGGKLMITFDFGSVVSSSTTKLMERAMSLSSMTDAVNLLMKEGWQFSGSDIRKERHITSYQYYMTK